MSATLFVVGTPIGNLKDITLRALETLKNVDLIACEDTRHTMILLNAYGISKPLISCYRGKENESAEKILSELNAGKDVALVSDAGMPAVSDPGAVVVNECISKGFRVESVPGPSAVATAFSVSKAGERKRIIERMPSFKMPVAVYVAPHDIDKILPELKAQAGIGRITVVKELTKIHESVIRIDGEIPDFDRRGEFVVIAEPKETASTDTDAFEALEKLLKNGATPSSAAKEISALYGVNKNALYRRALEYDKK